MGERNLYTNREGVAEPNALLDYEQFLKARKAFKEMAEEVYTASPDGVIDGFGISGKTMKKHPVRGGIYFWGFVSACVAVPLFLVNGLVATFAPAPLSADAPIESRAGNAVGRTVNYIGSTLGRPVVAELAAQTYGNDGKFQTTQVNQEPTNYNYSSGVLLTSDGGNNPPTRQGLTQQQQEAISRLSGN